MVSFSTAAHGAKLGVLDEGVHDRVLFAGQDPSFAQAPMETIAEAYERFNDYIRAVPHHKFSREDVVQKFYQGLTTASRGIIDASAGGSIIELTPTQVFKLFKKVADNDTWASSGRLQPLQAVGRREECITSGTQRSARREDRLAHDKVGEDVLDKVKEDRLHTTLKRSGCIA